MSERVLSEMNLGIPVAARRTGGEVVMSAPQLLRDGAKLGLKLLGWLEFLPPLLTRLVIGYAFYLTGKGKLANFDRTVGFFTDLGIPAPELNAAFVSRLEFWGGLLLVVGLLTRLVAAGLSSTMVVAMLTADKENFLNALKGVGDAGLTDIVPVVFLLFLVYLVIYGPGVLSLDTLVGKLLRVEKPAASDGHA